MVESKLVELVVAGSNPVGHPSLDTLRVFFNTRSDLPQKVATHTRSSPCSKSLSAFKIKVQREIFGAIRAD
jgi:hypothetical protein